MKPRKSTTVAEVAKSGGGDKKAMAGCGIPGKGKANPAKIYKGK